MEAFKIGKSEENRVIVAKLKNIKQKEIVMEHKRKLKGSKTFIENDMTSQEMEIQNKIWTMAKKEMMEGEKVRVGYQKMFKQNKVYLWDKKDNTLKLKNDPNQTPKN